MAKISYDKTASQIIEGSKKIVKSTKNVNKTFKDQKAILIALVQGQEKMILALNKISHASNKVTASTKRVNQQTLLWTKNTRILGGSLAVLRSKLLIISFGMALVQKSIGSLVKAYGDFEASQNRIERAIASTGGAAGMTKEEVFAMSASLEESTGIAEGLINTSAGLLLTFTNIGESVFPQATQAVLDMTSAMYQGSVSVDNLRSTSVQVGKALNDPIKGISALSRVGVAFTFKQKLMIKALVNTNQLAKAQTIIIKELNKEFSGQAALEGYNKTMRELSTALESTAESIGKTLRPAVEDMAKWATKMLKSFNPDGVVAFIKQLTLLIVGFGLLKKALLVSLTMSLKHITSLSRMWKVAKLAAFNFVGLTSAVRKSTVAVRGLTVASRVLMGPIGWIGMLIPAILMAKNMFNKTSDEIDSNTLTVEENQRALNKFTKSREEANIAMGKGHYAHLELTKLIKNLGLSYRGPAASIKNMNKLLDAHQRKLEENLQISKDKKEQNASGTATGNALAEAILKERYALELEIFTIEAIKASKGTLISVNQDLIKVIGKLGLHINTDTGEILSYSEALKQMDKDTLKLINTIGKLSIDAETRKWNDQLSVLKQLGPVNRELVKMAQKKGLDDKALIEALKDETNEYHKLSKAVEKVTRWKKLEGELVNLATQFKDQHLDMLTQQADAEIAIQDKIMNNDIADIKKSSEYKRAQKRGDDKEMARLEAQARKKSLPARDKAFKDKRNVALSGVWINTSLAIMKAFSDYGWPLGLIPATLLGAIGSQQAEQIKSQPGPAFAQGGDFITSGPQNITVGDNPGGRERVSITPLSSPNIAGPDTGGPSVTVNVSGNVMSQEYVEGELAEQIKEAIRRGEDFGIS